MSRKYFYTPEVQAQIDAINATGKTWYSISLPDHPLRPQFDRKLCVVGFNTPYMQNDEDRIYVNIVEQLIFKDSGVLYKTIELENWLITESNKEELLDSNGNICEVEWQEINENGGIIATGKETVKVASVPYVRYLINTKSVHLVDVIALFMPLYVQLHQIQIDNI